MKHEEQLLRAFECKCGNNHIAAALERAGYGIPKLLDREVHGAVKAVAVGALHNDDIVAARWIGIAQQRAAAITDIAGEQDIDRPSGLRKLKTDAGGS